MIIGTFAAMHCQHGMMLAPARPAVGGLQLIWQRDRWAIHHPASGKAFYTPYCPLTDPAPVARARDAALATGIDWTQRVDEDPRHALMTVVGRCLVILSKPGQGRRLDPGMVPLIAGWYGDGDPSAHGSPVALLVIADMCAAWGAADVGEALVAAVTDYAAQQATRARAMRAQRQCRRIVFPTRPWRWHAVASWRAQHPRRLRPHEAATRRAAIHAAHAVSPDYAASYWRDLCPLFWQLDGMFWEGARRPRRQPCARFIARRAAKRGLLRRMAQQENRRRTTIGSRYRWSVEPAHTPDDWRDSRLGWLDGHVVCWLPERAA